MQQKRYDEARIFFSALETSLKATGLKRELLRVKVRLAMCYLTCGDAAGAVRLMEEIASILETQDYGQLVLTAIQRYPMLISLSKRKRS
ncbi:MAG TPA: hypothetical protein VFQ30_04565 [Ktedonobacteraceae bacterium]|nr:hypothetical protein [Ktedonobacteraceae bacterium]